MKRFFHFKYSDAFSLKHWQWNSGNKEEKEENILKNESEETDNSYNDKHQYNLGVGSFADSIQKTSTSPSKSTIRNHKRHILHGDEEEDEVKDEDEVEEEYRKNESDTDSDNGQRNCYTQKILCEHIFAVYNYEQECFEKIKLYKQKGRLNSFTSELTKLRILNLSGIQTFDMIDMFLYIKVPSLKILNISCYDYFVYFYHMLLSVFFYGSGNGIFYKYINQNSGINESNGIKENSRGSSGNSTGASNVHHVHNRSNDNIRTTNGNMERKDIDKDINKNRDSYSSNVSNVSNGDNQGNNGNNNDNNGSTKTSEQIKRTVFTEQNDQKENIRYPKAEFINNLNNNNNNNYNSSIIINTSNLDNSNLNSSNNNSSSSRAIIGVSGDINENSRNNEYDNFIKNVSTFNNNGNNNNNNNNVNNNSHPELQTLEEQEAIYSYKENLTNNKQKIFFTPNYKDRIYCNGPNVPIYYADGNYISVGSDNEHIFQNKDTFMKKKLSTHSLCTSSYDTDLEMGMETEMDMKTEMDIKMEKEKEKETEKENEKEMETDKNRNKNKNAIQLKKAIQEKLMYLKLKEANIRNLKRGGYIWVVGNCKMKKSINVEILYLFKNIIKKEETKARKNIISFVNNLHLDHFSLFNYSLSSPFLWLVLLLKNENLKTFAILDLCLSHLLCALFFLEGFLKQHLFNFQGMMRRRRKRSGNLYFKLDDEEEISFVNKMYSNIINELNAKKYIETVAQNKRCIHIIIYIYNSIKQNKQFVKYVRKISRSFKRCNYVVYFSIQYYKNKYFNKYFDIDYLYRHYVINILMANNKLNRYINGDYSFSDS